LKETASKGLKVNYTKVEAGDKLAEKLREVKLLSGMVCADPHITVAEYFAQWIDKVALTSEPRTTDTYSGYFRLHILLEFGSMRIQTLHRARIKKAALRGCSRGLIRPIFAEQW
jgi:Phage integrase, N-terminal SAM-like domain